MNHVKFKKTHLQLNEAYRKVMCWFFSFPAKELSLNDLTKLTNISKTTANKIVKKLVNEGFLKTNPLGKIWRITCNQKHEFNTIRKIPYNLELIYQSGIIGAVLKNTENPRAIILFGSYRKGDDTENSDIDIAVETFNDEEINFLNLGTIPVLGYRQNVKVHLVKFARNKIDLNLFTNIANGIVLYGLLEVRP